MTGVTSEPQLIISGPASLHGQRYGLAGAETLVGREPSAELRLDEPTVSRRHALLTCDGAGDVSVRDLDSSAGTYVNGERLSRTRLLAPGDELRFGNVVARFTGADPDATASVPALTMPVPRQAPDPARDRAPHGVAHLPADGAADHSAGLQASGARPPGEDAATLLAQARQALAAQRWADSAESFQRLTRWPSHAAEAYYGLGLIELRSGTAARAEQLFRQSVTLDSRFANAWYQLGQIYEARSLPKAVAFYRAALEINPRHKSAAARVAAIEGSHSAPPGPPPSTALPATSASVAHAPMPPAPAPVHPAPAAQFREVAPADRRGAPAIPRGLLETAVERFLRDDHSPLSQQAIDLIDRMAVRRTRLNVGARLGRMLIITVAAAIVSAGLRIASGHVPAGAVSVTQRAAIWVWFLWLILIAGVIIRQCSSIVTIANARIYLRTGIFRRRLRTLDIWTVENIQLQQSVLNRLTTDGTLLFTGTHIGRGGGFSKKGFKLTGVARGGDLQLLYQQLEDLKFVLRANPVVKGIIS